MDEKDEVCLKSMLSKFFEEHLHDDEEIRLCVEGSGYFDIRNFQEQWVRVEVNPGDLIILPAGSYHRFTLDSNQFIRAKRYFIDQPNWTPFNRPADERSARKEYLEKFASA
jgi:1,2-dihydroxy-3-keto-5-methylthiopentene dioxygenase